VRLPADGEEVHARIDRLLERALLLGAVPTYVDDDGVLHVGGNRTILSRLEGCLLRLLLDARGAMVSRADAVAALWPEGPPSDPRALDNRLKNLRQRLAHLPLQIHTVRGRGLMVEWDAAALGETSGTAAPTLPR
jgi:DNA-binding response OmpR family regulator